jgi:hypothetical protein
MKKRPKLQDRFFVVFSGYAARRGLGLLVSRCFVITHNDAPQSVVQFAAETCA